MSASEEMMRERLDRIIARAEMRVEQWSIHASALLPYGDQAKKARSQLGLVLMGLAKLKKYRSRADPPTARAKINGMGTRSTWTVMGQISNMGTFRAYLRPAEIR